MENILPVLLQQGSLGIVASIFIYLYLNERNKNQELQNKISTTYEHHYRKLDEVRQAQIEREQEVAQTLEAYGKGVVEAVRHTTAVADELRRLHHEQRP
jgi:hypothetical protein